MLGNYTLFIDRRNAEGTYRDYIDIEKATAAFRREVRKVANSHVWLNSYDERGNGLGTIVEWIAKLGE